MWSEYLRHWGLMADGPSIAPSTSLANPERNGTLMTSATRHGQ